MPDVLAAEGGFEASFYDGTRRGLQVNDVDWRNLLARAQFADRGTLLRETEAEPEVTSPKRRSSPFGRDAPRFDAEPVLETEALDAIEGDDELEFEDDCRLRAARSPLRSICSKNSAR